MRSLRFVPLLPLVTLTTLLAILFGALFAPAAQADEFKGNAKGNALLYQLVRDFKVPTFDPDSSCGSCGIGGWTPGVRYGGRFGVAYTTTPTCGPYRGDLDETSSEPGHVPDGEARAISCQNSQEPILKGAFRINHQTSHGTTDRDALRFSSIGTFWDTENDSLRFGGFVHPTGRDGWNSVSISILCFHAYA
jgi:hypothetical protein